MNQLQFTPIAALLLGLISFGSTPKITLTARKADDGSMAAITRASADLPLDKLKMPAGFSISVYAEVEGGPGPWSCPLPGRFLSERNEQVMFYAVKDTDGIN
jgi:hypothetical protein